MARKEKQPEKKGPPPWLGTYGDMITNLMTFFVLLLTFSSKTEGEFRQFKDSLFSGPFAGFGIVREVQTAADNYRDALLDRAETRASRVPREGSRIPPRYQEELIESVGRLREILARGIHDEHLRAVVVRLRRDDLVGPDGKLTATGKLLIRSIASVFHRFPYDIQFLAGSPADLDAAVACASELHELWQDGGYVATGLYPGGAAPGTVFLALVAETAVER